MAPTLAQRVNQLREIRNMTVRDLARSARMEFQRIEDIEGGLETWLSITDRQLLSRALGVEPHVLQEVETRNVVPAAEQSSAFAQDLALRVLNGDRDLECPNCGAKLQCSVQEALDIEGAPLRFPKAFCTKCPWLLK